MYYSELSNNQMRIAVDLRQTFEVYREARRNAARSLLFPRMRGERARKPMTGLRFPLSRGADLGVKYRYFNVSNYDFENDVASFT